MTEVAAMRRVREAVHADEGQYDRDELIAELEKEMLQAAEELDFEKAAALRDHIAELKSSPELKVAAADARPRVVARRRDGQIWKPQGQHRRPRRRRK
jgi:excinuclease ABC subunit B